ncbi:MAG TPA: SDR family NAD(P)-dependent oxidoreductase, partial [Pyrinomonadaceae bacterium]|nr:SDR family NAD(P)-dependent oxidoreductase [Pyrinomonadaceae bacterium]
MEIEGKRVLVSGASRGLGKALVAAFVAAGGGEVFAGTRTDEARSSLRQEFPERVTPIQLDVTSDADV